MIMSNIQKGINILLLLDNTPVAGQLNVNFNRSMAPINITNKIDGEWEVSLSGVKNWRIDCNGAYILGVGSFQQLEEAFMNNKSVNVKLQTSFGEYTGEALLTDFPLSSQYNDSYKYRISLLGTGKLNAVVDEVLY